MRWHILLILSLLILGGVACSYVAAAPASTKPVPSEMSSEEMVGYLVISNDGIEIGPMDGIVFNTKSGEAQYGVVLIKDIYNFGRGAVHEPQDRYLLIPWSRLEVAKTTGFVVDAPAAFVKAAPMLSTPIDSSVAGWDRAIADYWRE